MKNDTKPANQSASAPLIINWKLTEEKVKQLINCLDIVTKAGGLQNARVALPLADDLINAANDALQSEHTKAD